MECISFRLLCRTSKLQKEPQVLRKEHQSMKFLKFFFFFFAISYSDPHDHCRCILYLTPVHGDPGDHQGRELFPDPERSASGFYSQWRLSTPPSPEAHVSLNCDGYRTGSLLRLRPYQHVYIKIPIYFTQFHSNCSISIIDVTIVLLSSTPSDAALSKTTRERNLFTQIHQHRWNASRKQPASFKFIVATTLSTVCVYYTPTFNQVTQVIPLSRFFLYWLLCSVCNRWCCSFPAHTILADAFLSLLMRFYPSWFSFNYSAFADAVLFQMVQVHHSWLVADVQFFYPSLCS